jgi:hypothetical protein
MKSKYCFLLVCFASSSVSSLGQNLNRFDVAIFGGVTFATFASNKSPYNEMNYKAKFISTFSYGVQLKYKIIKSFWISSGINKVTLGTTIDYENQLISPKNVIDERWKLNIKNQYWNIPLMVEYHSKDKLNWFAKVGGYLGILTNSNMDGSYVSIRIIDNVVNKARYDQLKNWDEKYTNSLDYGIVFGGGLRYPLNSKINIQFEATSLVGLKQVDAINNNSILRDYPGGPVTAVFNYFGLSSESKNIVMLINTGLSYRL